MTTRREIIKAGAGLTAILAAGKAPASLVRSMLAARGAIMMGGGRKALPQMSFVITGSSFTSNASSQGLTTDDGSPVVIDWGDGTKTTSASGASLGNHTYANSGTYVAKVYSDGVITRIEQRCFYANTSLVDIDIPPTVVYLGLDCFRACGLTEFTFQRQFTYGYWPLWGNYLAKATFDGNFKPDIIQTVPSYWNGATIILGPNVLDNDIRGLNASTLTEYQGISNVGVDSGNPYFEVRGTVPQIVRKSDNALVLIALSLVGGRNWAGQGIDPSVKIITDGLTHGLTSTVFTVPDGITSGGANFCRDSSTLTTVNLPSTFAGFGMWPFYASSNITTIHCAATTPPVVSGSFGNLPSGATIHVPAGCLAAYQASSFWSRFASIVDDLQ